MSTPGINGTLKLGQATHDRIRPGDDTDFFAVKLKAENLYTFSVKGSQDGHDTLFDPTMALFDRHGNIISSNSDFNGRDPQIEFRADRTGKFFVGVASENERPGTYTIAYNLADPAPGSTDDDGTGTELDIKIGQKRSGEINTAGDDDWYKIKLQGNKTYTAFARNRNQEDPTDFIADAIIRDKHGNIVDDVNEYEGNTPPIGVDNTFQTTYSGVYYIDVRDIADSTAGNFSIYVGKGAPFPPA